MYIVHEHPGHGVCVPPRGKRKSRRRRKDLIGCCSCLPPPTPAGRLQAALLVRPADRPGHHAGPGQAAHAQRHLHPHHQELPLLQNRRQRLAGRCPPGVRLASVRPHWVPKPRARLKELALRYEEVLDASEIPWLRVCHTPEDLPECGTKPPRVP